MSTITETDPIVDTARSVEGHGVLVAGPPIDERESRLAAGADGLASGRSGIIGGSNILVVIAGALLTTGLCAIVLGYWGAANSTILEEQVPYLISGGLLGVALSIVGGIVYFAQWITVLVRDGRAAETARARDHQELVDELRALRLLLLPPPAPPVSPPTGRAGRAPRRASTGDG